MLNYQCDKCNATDCKLWRDGSIGGIELICWECLEQQGHRIKVNDERPDDQVYDRDISNACYLPAVPDLDGRFWGYTSVPVWWVEWWKNLPDKKTECTTCRGSKKLGRYECVTCDGTGNR